MKIKQIKEAVDWSKSMDGNDNNLDRIRKLKNLQVDIPPVMGDALKDDENFDKNAKEVFTKLSKDAEGITPKDPDTGKKIKMKPYTERLTLDESMFRESWSAKGSFENQSVKSVTYEEDDISDVAEELMNWYGDYFEGWEAADIKHALYGLDGERIPNCDCPIIFTMEESEEDDYDWDDEDEEYDECMNEDYDRPVATMGLTNTSGIGIFDINDDEVTYAFFGGEKPIEKETAEIEWDCESEECRPYFSVGEQKYYIDEFIRTDLGESKKDSKCSLTLNEDDDEGNDLWKAYGDEEEEDEEETVYDFVDARLFGTNKNGRKPNSSNYKMTNKFLSDITIPLSGGKKGRFGNVFFYPDNTEYMSGSEKMGRPSRRYPMFDDGFGVYLVDEGEGVLAKAVADELKFNYKVDRINSDKGFNYVAKIFIPESILDMPIAEYLDSIGKSLTDYKGGKRRGRKPREQK